MGKYKNVSFRVGKKGAQNATYPCELNGVNVAATSPVSFWFEAGAMTEIPDSQTEKERQKL